MPLPTGLKESNQERVEGDGVTPLAGGHVVSCLRAQDVKEHAKSLKRVTVSHHWLEDVLYQVSAYRM